MSTLIIIPAGHVSGSDNGAKKIACDGYLKDYDAKTATVQQMKTYADCVNTLYPTDFAGAKAIVICFLLAVVIGAVIGYLNESNEPVLGVMFGAISGVLIVGVILLIGFAISFIFS